MAVLGLVLCYCGLAVLAFTLVWLPVAETDVSDIQKLMMQGTHLESVLRAARPR